MCCVDAQAARLLCRFVSLSVLSRYIDLFCYAAVLIYLYLYTDVVYDMSDRIFNMEVGTFYVSLFVRIGVL